MIGILMLGVFAVCAALMSLRLLPALLAVPLMALAVAALAGAGPSGLAAVVVDGTVKLAPVMVTVIFGALLSRVTMQTGIAETIVNYAAEFGGDEPILVALLMSAVVAALFTSLYGLGAIIMVGSIVLPIMMTVGVPRRTAATLFMLAYALGFIFNIAQWKFYTQTFGVERAALQPFAYALAALDAAALIVFVVVRFRRTRGYATWSAAPVATEVRRRAPILSLVTPVLPIALYFAFGMNPVLAFALSAVFGVATTRPSRGVRTLVESAIRGVEDVAPAVLLFMGIGMLLVATGLPAVRSALEPVVAAIAPRNGIAYVALFGLLSPLALYRGPLNPYGVGIGVYTVLASLGILPPAILVAAVMAVVQVQNACDPTNTQNVWVANFTGVGVDEILRITLPFQVAVATLATVCVVAFGPALFGRSVFAPSVPPAAAATIAPSEAAAWPGLFAPPDASRMIAIGHEPDELSARAADEVSRQIAGGWDGFRTMPLRDDPGASDCSTKPYVAVLRVSAAVTPAAESLTLDTGIELLDCAGWPVDEWHAGKPLSATPSAQQAEASALSLLVRLRTWMLEHRTAADALFERGLAYGGHAAPTYLYTLFKTNDGQMRAFVRPGGPAYAAGLRTNDIVEKIDGRYWWEYGTYASQRRAYDGLPHSFLVMRDRHELDVRLGAPYRSDQ